MRKFCSTEDIDLRFCNSSSMQVIWSDWAKNSESEPFQSSDIRESSPFSPSSPLTHSCERLKRFSNFQRIFTLFNTKVAPFPWQQKCVKRRFRMKVRAIQRRWALDRQRTCQGVNLTENHSTMGGWERANENAIEKSEIKKELDANQMAICCKYFERICNRSRLLLPLRPYWICKVQAALSRKEWMRIFSSLQNMHRCHSLPLSKRKETV